jgi:hypothetical protein
MEKRDSTTMSYRDVALHGRACGRQDAELDGEACALNLLESELWAAWPEHKRRLWEYAYHLAQIEVASTAR